MGAAEKRQYSEILEADEVKYKFTKQMTSKEYKRRAGICRGQRLIQQLLLKLRSRDRKKVKLLYGLYSIIVPYSGAYMLDDRNELELE